MMALQGAIQVLVAMNYGWIRSLFASMDAGANAFVLVFLSAVRLGGFGLAARPCRLRVWCANLCSAPSAVR